MRSSSLPGGASKVSDCGAAVVAADAGRFALAPVVCGLALASCAASGERPRYTRSPFSVAAITETRPGAGSLRRLPTGVFGSGSQTSVTFVLPFAPRSVPSHVRTYLPDWTDTAIDASAASTGLAASDTAGPVVVAFSAF